jgi:hypothetical protein
MTTSILLLHLFLLVAFSIALGLKMVYVFYCIKIKQFTMWPKIYAITMIATLWFIYITIEALIKGVNG